MPVTYSSKAMLEKLVSFDTTSHLSNLALIEFVEDYIGQWNLGATRVPNEDGKKSSLFFSIGPKDKGGVVLSGHSDVVPVVGQPWVTDPFQLTEKDGKLFGRGSCDMKGFLAVALALLPKMAERPLKKPIHFAISYDEEVGCTGVRPMLERLGKLMPTPSVVLVGEPTSMQLVTAHKGIFSFYTRIRGKEAHSSLPQAGANAIMAAGRIVNFIYEMAEEKRANPMPGSQFEPPYTSFNVGVIQGGTAQNIIPLDCWFSWEYRLHPGDDGPAIKARYDAFVADKVLPWLRRHAPDATIETSVRSVVPPLKPEKDGAAEALVRYLSGSNATAVVSYGTEGGLFQDAGYSTVICGPGAIDQAHQPNEFVALDQLHLCEKLLEKLIDWARG